MKLFCYQTWALSFKVLAGWCLLFCLQSCSGLTSQTRQQQIDTEFLQAKQYIAEGKINAGIKLLEQLTAQQPANAEYRNALKLQRELNISEQIQAAEIQLKQGDAASAQAKFNDVLVLDPDNQRAINGLKKVANFNKHQTLLDEAQRAYEAQDYGTARSVVRRVLAENAANKEARALFEKLDEAHIEEKNSVPAIKSAFKRPVSLEFNNAPVKSVFDYIGKAGGINFTFDREVSDAMLVSVILRDTPIEQAIETILMTNQLDKKILNENTLLIYPISRRHEYEESYVRSFYLSNMDAKQAMTLLQTVLHVENVYIDEQLNTLVMRDTLDTIKTAEKLITSQDLVEPEVMLEVEVMEVNRRNLEEIGIRYPVQVGIGVEGEDDIPGRLTLTELKNFNSDFGVFSITDPVLALNLLQKDTDTNLLANPKIRVKNRDTARIHVGDKVPVLTSVSNSTGFVSQSVSYIEVGIKLEVEPTILIQNEVSIDVKLEVSNIIDQITTNSGVVAYSIGSRNAETTLQLKDGETQILAGLFKDDRQNTSYKVPGLSDLPFIGRFFTDENSDNQKSEIVLLITPRILHNIVPANAVYTTFPAGINRTDTGRQPQAYMPRPILPNPQAPIVESDADRQDRNASNAEEFARQILQGPVDGM